jgi:hypothetical protein
MRSCGLKKIIKIYTVSEVGRFFIERGIGRGGEWGKGGVGEKEKGRKGEEVKG